MEFDYYVQLIKGRMGERRFIHSVNVSDAAVALAERYGADKEKARLAGILHDSCKEIPNNGENKSRTLCSINKKNPVRGINELNVKAV